MALKKNKSQYETKYRQYKITSGDGANTTPSELQEQLTSEGQISEFTLEGTETLELNITVTETDTSNVLHDITLAGSSSYNKGSFDEPLVEFGASCTVAVEIITNPSSVGGVQMKLDERTG